MRKLNLVLALGCGLAGGVISHHLAPRTVQAHSPTAPAAEVRARSFVVVNHEGRVVGTFAAEAEGRPAIRLFDPSGRELWSAEKPTLLKRRGSGAAITTATLLPISNGPWQQTTCLWVR